MNDQSLVAPAIVNRGGSQSDLRRHNERVVLSALRRHPGLFNAELSRRTGLAAQTISVILRALEEQRLIRRGEVLRGRRGQPATPIYLDPHGAYAFGCALGWRQLDLVLIDLDGEVVVSENWSYSAPDPDEMLEQIADRVERLTQNLPAAARRRARRMGLALPSMGVGAESIKGVPDAIVSAWRDYDIAGALSARLGIPVRPIGDGAAACGAENRQIMALHYADFGYLHLGYDLSGGVVLGGRLFTGRGDKAPDLGGMVVCRGDGPLKRATDIAGAAELELRLTGAGVPVPQAIGPDWDWRAAGPSVTEWAGDAAQALAQVIHNTQALLDCSAFVIDGLLPDTLVGELIARTEAAMAHNPEPPGGPVRLIRGQLGASAAAMGAADISLFETFFALDNQA